MTGTANEFYNDNQHSALNNIDLFSAWLFDKINANCTLSDLSPYGCSILIPKKQLTPVGAFNLLIMSLDNSDYLHTVLKAEQRWENADYSSTHKKIGIKFHKIDYGQLMEIKVLMKHLKNTKQKSIKCSLLKR